MAELKQKNILKGQLWSGIGVLVVGIVHILAHLLIPQAREALFYILKAGVVNTLGMDWATATFSTLMSLVVGMLFLVIGILIIMAARVPWKIPLLPAIALSLVFIFIVVAGPNGGGWLGLPSCVFLVYQAIKGRC
jgi:hypothetical protein